MKNYLFLLQETQIDTITSGTFYVIETFPYPQFALGEDGMPLSFDNYEEAVVESMLCQEGYVIGI